MSRSTPAPIPDAVEDRALEIAAMALHRWKHPSKRLGQYDCGCRQDAEMARSLLDKEVSDDPA